MGDIMKLRGLLDTNILVAGLSRQSGASAALLMQALNGRFTMLASPTLWLEYEAVLKRPAIGDLHGITHLDIDDVLSGLASVIEPVTSNYLWRPQLRDPQDEMVLEAAVNGLAHHLVTLNVRDFTPAASRFGLTLTSPGQFLNLVETTT